MMKKGIMKSKKNATYTKRSFIITKIKEWNLNYTKKLEIIDILQYYDNGETITYKIKFVDSCRFMPSKLSDLVDNLSEIKNKVRKTCIERKNIKSECEFTGFKNNRLSYRCKEYNGTSAKSVNDLIGKFRRMHKSCNGHLNRFFLLLRKGVYPYEYMGSC